MARNRFGTLLVGLTAGGISLGMPPVVANAQLRPLDAQPWRLVAGSSTISASIGASVLGDQRASLAGTTGDLFEIGNFSLAWRTGRVALEISGTAQRLLDETARFAEPYRDVAPSDDGRRQDSGDYRIATSVRFTPASFPVAGAIRFGTRLPTTDNTTGLDRDAIDFFATVGGQSMRNKVSLGGELGLGIFSTREEQFEQDDMLLYELHVEYGGRRATPFASVVGQKHGISHNAIRGVEDLGEARFGVRIGGARWIKVELVKGYESFSPSAGLIVSVGLAK